MSEPFLAPRGCEPPEGPQSPASSGCPSADSPSTDRPSCDGRRCGLQAVEPRSWEASPSFGAPPGLLSGFEGVGFAIPSGIAVMALACTGTVAALDSVSLFHRSGVSPDSPVGWVAILGAVLPYGSFGFLTKAPAVKALGAGPNVWQVYINVGVSLTFLAAGAFLLEPSDLGRLSWWGVLGGCLWPIANIMATVGIGSLGYGVSFTIWAGVTIAISFIWGSCVFGQPLRSMLGSLAGLAVLVLGISTSAASSEVQRWKKQRGSEDAEAAEGQQARDIAGSSAAAKAGGLLATILGASLNGSLNAPFEQFAASAVGLAASAPELAYLVSFVPGTAACTAAIIGRAWATGRPMHCRALLVPGVLTGFYWASGYICALYATRYLGNNVGYPLCQMAIIVSGLWAILYYREITAGLAIGIFSASVALILAGAAMLATWAVV